MPAIVDMHKLRDVEGIASLIGISGRAYPIADGFISTVKEAEEAGAFDFTPRGVPNYTAGQKVKITKGPFKGLTATIAKATRDGRASLIMQAVYGRGSVKPVKINVEHIEPADLYAA